MAEAYTLFNHLPELTAALKRAADQAVRKAALDVERGAKERAPVATGFMRGSIYAVTHTSSDYGQAGSPPAGASLLPEIEKPPEGTAYVAVGANYGAYVEMGTSRMAAQPYLIPAAEAERPAFLAAMAKIEAAMRVAAKV